jgi:hypothetical protein
MTNHSELLNLIAKKIHAKIYIEIGVFNPEHNFNKIEVEEKIGVDPDPNAGATACMTSDNFFSFFKKIGGHADLVWIDGLHHADQVKKDIENAWEIVSPGGVIAIHDCNPHKESITHVPRDSREWCGNVYEAICCLSLPKFTIDFDYGCCVIRKESRLVDFETETRTTVFSERTVSFSNVLEKGKRAEAIPREETPFLLMDVCWEYFDQNRKELLNLKTVDEAIEIIEAWT